MTRSDDDRPTDVHEAVDDDSLVDAPTYATPNAHLPPGTDVGGYLVDGELGSGAMGVVYSATHPLIGKRAAIKVLKPELSNNPAAVERFVMEARAVNQIGHPNIVDIFAFGQLPDGRSYYVMDLLDGEPLRWRLKRGPLHVSEAASVIDEVASALMAAHAKGIIHRDLKPDNIFMVTLPGRWPEVRILDWGLLKLSTTQTAVASGKYRTLAGSVLGTPVYMSPEQARASDKVDFRADVYSLGVTAYEILSGDVPFRKGSSIDTLLAHQDEPVPPLAHKCPALPEELVQLIEAMLAKEPGGRPTLAAVRAVIKRLKGSKIPTMTAAGLAMPPSPMSSLGAPPLRHPADEDAMSMAVTTRRAPPNSARSSEPAEVEATPLPAPPTAGDGRPRISTPYQSMHVSPMQTTLAGHSVPIPVPSPQRPSQPQLQPPSQPQLLQPDERPSQPYMHAGPSQPYMHPGPSQPYVHAGPSQPHPTYPMQPQHSMSTSRPAARAPSNTRSIILAVVLALVAATIGIVLLVTN